MKAELPERILAYNRAMAQRKEKAEDMDVIVAALLALPLALGLRLCRTARRAPDPEGAAVAAACAAALLARTAAYALANLGWTATEPNLPLLLRTDLGCAADLAAACAGLAADARLRPLRRAGKGGMLFPCAGLRRAGRRERA